MEEAGIVPELESLLLAAGVAEGPATLDAMAKDARIVVTGNGGWNQWKMKDARNPQRIAAMRIGRCKQ